MKNDSGNWEYGQLGSLRYQSVVPAKGQGIQDMIITII